MCEPKMSSKRPLKDGDVGLLNSYLINKLSERDQTVLRLYFSDIILWAPDNDFTYEDVGAVIGVSRERARQIVARALHRIRLLEEKRRQNPRASKEPTPIETSDNYRYR